PTPSTMMSPGTRARSSINARPGVVMKCSTASTSSKRSGSGSRIMAFASSPERGQSCPPVAGRKKALERTGLSAVRSSGCSCGGRKDLLRRRRRHRTQGGEICRAGNGKARTVERAQRQAAVGDPETDVPAGVAVEIGMGRGEGKLLRTRGERHAVDEMMAIALDMAEAEQGDEREILLHADAGERGEILGRHEIALAPGLAIELADTRGVEDRLVEALAVLARHAGIAQLA